MQDTNFTKTYNPKAIHKRYSFNNRQTGFMFFVTTDDMEKYVNEWLAYRQFQDKRDNYFYELIKVDKF